MPHVGVKGFGAGGAKEDRAKHEEAADAVIEKICQSDARIERPEHVRMLRDAREAKRADDEEPQRHDRAENAGDLAVPCDCTLNSPTSTATDKGTT